MSEIRALRQLRYDSCCLDYQRTSSRIIDAFMFCCYTQAQHYPYTLLAENQKLQFQLFPHEFWCCRPQFEKKNAVCDIRVCMSGADRPKTRQVTTIWSKGLVVVVRYIKNILLHSRDARNAARSNKWTCLHTRIPFLPQTLRCSDKK